LGSPAPCTTRLDLSAAPVERVGTCRDQVADALRRQRGRNVAHVGGGVPSSSFIEQLALGFAQRHAKFGSWPSWRSAPRQCCGLTRTPMILVQRPRPRLPPRRRIRRAGPHTTNLPFSPRGQGCMHCDANGKAEIIAELRERAVRTPHSSAIHSGSMLSAASEGIRRQAKAVQTAYASRRFEVLGWRRPA